MAFSLTQNSGYSNFVSAPKKVCGFFHKIIVVLARAFDAQEIWHGVTYLIWNFVVDSGYTLRLSYVLDHSWTTLKLSCVRLVSYPKLFDILTVTNV